MSVFVALLVVSLLVGFIVGFIDRKQSADRFKFRNLKFQIELKIFRLEQRNSFSYLLNNEDMNPITAGLSIFVSMLSALTIIGLPVEVYLYGDAMVMRMFGGIIGVLTVNYIFLPKTFELKLYSIFRLDSLSIIPRDFQNFF